MSPGMVMVFVLLVVFGAYFAGAESSFSALNKIKLKTMADDGNKRAKTAMYIVNNFERALTTLLIGNNITHIAAASVATVIATRLLAGENGTLDSTQAFLCTLVTTAIVFLFSEMIPKTLANDRSETVSMLCAKSLRVLMKVFYPLASFFGAISSFFSKLFATEAAPTVTEEELYDIVETAEEEGVMDESQSDLFRSALDFSDTTAADVMTMREDIVMIDVKTPNDEVDQLIKSVNHSRIPVYQGTPDHVIGILHIRKFLKEYHKNHNVHLRPLLTAPFFVKENAKIDELLTNMRQRKIYIALVRDNENKIRGLVTIEDFLEELVGEIWDEDDVVDDTFVKLGGNRFSVDTHLTVGEAFKRMHVTCDDPALASKAILPWLIEQLERMPEEGDTFTYQNIEVTVGEVNDGKIEHVEMHLLDDAPATNAETDAAEKSEGGADRG